jgi:lysophospholipase L1-like esterase
MRALAAGLLIALAAIGCGEDEPASERGAVVVAALGDSITAGSPLWDPRPHARAALPRVDRRSQYEYWAERALPGTDFRNCGVPGERTFEIALRVESCVRGADVLIVQGGVNDIAHQSGAGPPARNLREIVRRGKALGLRVAIVELLPWNTGYPGAAPVLDELNRRIHALAREEGVPVIEWYELLEDPARPDRMRERHTADGAHPSVAGYRLLGEALELPP